MKRFLLAVCLYLLGTPLYGQIARVGNAVRTIGTSSSGTTQTAPAVALTAGNAVVVWETSGSNTVAVSTVADNCGNSYASVTNTRTTSAAVGQVEIFEKRGVSSGASCVVTVTWASAVTFRSVIVTQWSKTESDWVLDGGHLGSGTGGTAATGSVASASNDNVFVAFFADDAGSNPTAGTGYTTITGADGSGVEAEQDINTAQTTQTATFTSFGGASWLVDVVVLSEATSGGARRRQPVVTDQ